MTSSKACDLREKISGSESFTEWFIGLQGCKRAQGKKSNILASQLHQYSIIELKVKFPHHLLLHKLHSQTDKVSFISLCYLRKIFDKATTKVTLYEPPT